MRYCYFLFSIFFALVLNGCSSSTVEPVKELHSSQESKINTTKKQKENESFDNLLEEFSEDTQVKKVYDPLIWYNRSMTTFNDNLFEYFLTPVAKGYKYILHEEIRNSVDNFFVNMFFPTRFVNNLLQLKFKNSLEESGRFVINSTIGILGLFDPALSIFGLEEHKEDFGQTLGFYGVSSGPHIVLPFFGPSNLRDIFGLALESYTDPLSYYNIKTYKDIDSYYPSTEVHNARESYKRYILLKTYEKVNYTSLHINDYQELKKDAIDLYPYLKDVYEQYRDKQIRE